MTRKIPHPPHVPLPAASLQILCNLFAAQREFFKEISHSICVTFLLVRIVQCVTGIVQGNALLSIYIPALEIKIEIWDLKMLTTSKSRGTWSHFR